MQRSKQEPVEAVFTTTVTYVCGATRWLSIVFPPVVPQVAVLSRASKLHGWLVYEIYIALPTTLINNALAFYPS